MFELLNTLTKAQERRCQACEDDAGKEQSRKKGGGTHGDVRNPGSGVLNRGVGRWWMGMLDIIKADQEENVQIYV